ncbi:MASE4 domain-containing protein [Trinickia terrae]|nr:MASE4 domain-containing protein [Trinickia terrae]
MEDLLIQRATRKQAAVAGGFALLVLLCARFAATRQLMLCALGGAYAYTAAAVALQLLTYPGVITPTGLFGAGPASAGWIWVFWHGGFPLLAMLAALIRERFKHRSVDPEHVGSWAWALIGGPVALAVALGAFAIHMPLPQALGPATDAGHGAALVILFINVAAVVVVLSTGRLRAGRNRVQIAGSAPR